MEPKIRWFSKPKGMVSKLIFGPSEKLLYMPLQPSAP